MMAAISSIRPGFCLSSENSCTPDGSSDRKRSKPMKARSGLAVLASASISTGCTSVSSSRARGVRTAG